MKSYDELAEEYADETYLDENTYRGDVVTAFTSGMMKANELNSLEDKVEVLVKKVLGKYQAKVKIRNQTFSIGSPWKDKESAEWMCKMFIKALKGLNKHR